MATAGFDHASLEEMLRREASALGVKTGQMFLPIRVAVCGRKNAPPLFETLEVLAGARRASGESTKRSVCFKQRPETMNNRQD
jgi:glutamyl/glutaminyl-tRNA synthetase